MLRRITAIGLWAYFGWYLAAHVAALAALPLELAPVGGMLMATVALVDWRPLVRRPTPVRERSGAR
jgi:hypothetical protein